MKFIFITDLHMSSVTPGSRIDNYTEAVFKKFEYVLQQCVANNAILLIGGDFFMTPTQLDWIKNEFKGLIVKYGVRVLGIPGNHDLIFYNVASINRTSYQTLIGPGVVEDLLTCSVKIGDWTILAHEFGKSFPQVDDPNTIVLSHCFYNYGKEDRLSVSKQDIYNSNAKFVCFGHDHNQYPVELNNGTYVVRPGALTRGTSHTENRTRQVGYALINTDTMTVTYEPIPFALKFEEVFKQNYDVKKERTIVSFDEIQQFIDDLRNTKASIGPYDILLSMGKSERIVKRVTYYLESVGLINN